MTNGKNLRIILAGMAAALVVALVPVAQAKQSTATDADGVYVCNTASANGHGNDGELVVAAADAQGGIHFTTDLRAKGNGNMNAAEHSRALALCVAPPTTTVPPGSGLGGFVPGGGSNY